MSEDRYGLLTNFHRLFNPAMPKSLPEGQDLFRIKDAAPYFDLHEKTLREKIRAGEVHTIKHGPRKHYITREEIVRYWREKSKNS
jgi:hypothetical protein